MKRLVILMSIFVLGGAIFALQHLGTRQANPKGFAQNSASKLSAQIPDKPESAKVTQDTESKPPVQILEGGKISIAKTSTNLTPVAFSTSDGKKGWKVTIPGNRPLATVAVSDGKVFLGGGFGSHEFYALDAASGKKVWEYKTADDGPTAAVVQDGYVAFNTESCELEILTLDGKRVWKKWLGDPLMSTPAMANGKVYMVYPDSKGTRQHHLACFDVKTGKEFWKKPIAGEAITAPVIADEHVYVACLEGTMFCFNTSDGELAWKEKKNATTSPVVWNKQCYFSQRQEIALAQAGKTITQQMEQLSFRGAISKGGEVLALREVPAQKADYLDYDKRKASGAEMAKEMQDAAVGFGGASKGDAKMAQAKSNLGEASVSGVWSYQGSKPFVYKEHLYSAMGDTLKCVDVKSEKVLWQKAFQKKDKAALADRTLTPPALVNGKVFFCTIFGDVVCLSASTGEVLWSINIGESIVFQPAVAKGRVYVSTNSGSVYCIETGDAKDDGWLMWGANAAHNGLME